MAWIALDRRQNPVDCRRHPSATVRAVVVARAEHFDGRHGSTLRQAIAHPSKSTDLAVSDLLERCEELRRVAGHVETFVLTDTQILK